MIFGRKTSHLTTAKDASEPATAAETSSALAVESRRADPNWRSVVDAISDAAVVLDVNAMVIYHNALALDVFSRIRTGMPLSLLSRGPELLTAIEQARNKEAPIFVQLSDRVPVARSLSAIITAIGNDEVYGGEPAILVTFRDLTDQQRHAQLRADFIANASHELRTPLASMKAIIETLQGAARNDEGGRERFLAMLATQAHRMTRLIDDLLSLNRVEMRAHLPTSGVVDMHELLASVTQSLEPLAETSEISLKFEPTNVRAAVDGERGELTQVFQNLIQNAIRYGRAGGQVQITLGNKPGARRGREFLAVAITDDGPGIAAEHIPRLTERFYRVNAAESHERGGTGLGLAIVKYILNRHQGELDISSELGSGSTFTVLLPLSEK